MKFPALPIGLILFLPLAGLVAAQRDILPFLAFPPRPVFQKHAPFSPDIFALVLIFILAATLPLVKKGLAYPPASSRTGTYPLPWWGKAAMAGTGIFWCLAWTRFSGFASFQPHTFFPLWLCCILALNGLTAMRSGTCPLTASPKQFIMLFAVSAVFWWIFEYLNRFVGNWHYSGSQYPALTYFCLATLSFSTVLPAVESMKAFLMSFGPMNRGFKKGPAMAWAIGRPAGWVLMLLGSAALGLVGIFPDPLFFTVWIAPLFILLGYGLIQKAPHPFSGLATGDLTQVAAYALAALCCGFFWEMFNFYSLARWEYSIPYVQALHIFEMPVLGYAGYLPFGLECALVIHLTHNCTK
ncbi:MAG: hypothetical protein HUN04_07215 [Desulfobacter sp.]|nr:MAG: hypothetical protein HUN04_07215 [Desulfobacter sp.]